MLENTLMLSIYLKLFTKTYITMFGNYEITTTNSTLATTQKKIESRKCCKTTNKQKLETAH